MTAVSAEPGPRPRTAVLDVLHQAWLAVAGRPFRSLLTAAGVALGVAATTATLGVTATAAAAISDRFDAVRATQVSVRWPEDLPRPEAGRAAGLRRLNGVVGAGLLCEATGDRHRVATLDGAGGGSANVIAAQPDALAALHVTMVAGRAFDAGHGVRRDPVLLLDTVAARRLHVEAPGRMIFLDGRATLVLGVFTAPVGDIRLTAAVVVPYETCLDERNRFDRFGPASAVISTRLGAADQVAAEARLVLAPEAPDRLAALVPPDLRTFRQGVERDTAALFLGLSIVSLTIAALSVSNTTFVAVLERRAEIGLRRAVGASRRAVMMQFIVESSILGVTGGLAGTLAGIDVVSGVALAEDWLLVLDPRVLISGPLVGLLVGAVAGMYPAWTAGRVEPAGTLRGE
ncbi:ABC transporter permease [Dactylosporangium sp. CA-139066]|uniref:ABC transporter permease n=1 Tax=Dactylosporangium sp. CA-139066 TaxID=3239930 RepID=UPI003D8CAE4C